MLTLNFQLNDHVPEVGDAILDLRGLALVAALIGLGDIEDDQTLVGDLVLFAAAADDFAAHIPRDSGFGVAAHIAL